MFSRRTHSLAFSSSDKRLYIIITCLVEMSMFLQQPRQSRPQRYSISLPLEIPKNGGFIRSIAPLYTCFWSSSVVPATTL